LESPPRTWWQVTSDPGQKLDVDHNGIVSQERMKMQLGAIVQHPDDNVVREGSFASVKELITAINVHLTHHNLSPTPYDGKPRTRRSSSGYTGLEKPRPKLLCNTINETLY
jgi:hypothetical protein